MSSKRPNYLEAASTTKVDSKVLEVMIPYFNEIYSNASSNHKFGIKAKEAIENSRKQVAQIINAESEEIIFTSGATEAINLGIKGYLTANPDKGNHIVTVKTEHKAVLATCEYLETIGYEVTYLDVNEKGLISLDSLRESVRDNTSLFVIMYVNNEIGVIQPITEIGKIAEENNIAFFCDATQAIGKVNVDVLKDNIHMLSMSAHKLNGPKGIGALYKENTTKIKPIMHGGSQEKGLRPGTYNTPLIVGFGEENFKDSPKVPHIISITLNNHDAEEFLILKNNEFIASTGSACNSGIIEISHVLKAMNINSPERVIRISIEK